MTTDPYPEHTKVAAVKEHTQAAGEFLDWCATQGRAVCETGADGFWAPVGQSIEQLLAAWVGVDLRRLEAEKLDMLKEQRRINQQISQPHDGR